MSPDFDLNVIASVNVIDRMPKDCLWVLWHVAKYNTSPADEEPAQFFYPCVSLQHSKALYGKLYVRDLTNEHTVFTSFEHLHREGPDAEWHKYEIAG